MASSRRAESKDGLLLERDEKSSGFWDEALVRVSWRFRVTFWTLVALVKAWHTMFGRRLGRLQLPPVGPPFSLSKERITQTIRWIDGLVYRLLFCSKHRCFFRAYAVAVVLRRWGLPLVLNIGLRNLGPSAQTRGHCWLSLNGRKFYEHLKPNVLYPFAMGSAAGDIAYWVNFGVDRDIVRHRLDGSD